jgi:hypothetical protein
MMRQGWDTQIMKFRATLQLGGKTATSFEVPPEIVEGLGSTKRPPVVVTIKDHTYRTSIGSRGGGFHLPVSGEVRKKAGIAAGDELDVEVVLDTEPREVTVPADLATAFANEPVARKFFEGLTYSQKSWFVLGIEGAKKAETRARRVTEAIELLREGKTSKSAR